MPDDSLPQKRPAPAANQATFIDNADESETVGTYIQNDPGHCLAGPPRDVGRMLERYGTILPCYLDAHRLREIQGSHQRWPILRASRAANEGVGS